MKIKAQDLLDFEKKLDKSLGLDKTYVTIEVIQLDEESWEASLLEPSNISEGFGVKKVHVGRSGWEALMNMAENWKRAGFLD